MRSLFATVTRAVFFSPRDSNTSSTSVPGASVDSTRSQSPSWAMAVPLSESTASPFPSPALVDRAGGDGVVGDDHAALPRLQANRAECAWRLAIAHRVARGRQQALVRQWLGAEHVAAEEVVGKRRVAADGRQRRLQRPSSVYGRAT